MKHQLFIIFIFLCGCKFLQAQETNHLVPENWKIIHKTFGDLNKDGKNDVVIIAEDTRKENFIANERLGPDTLNLNPRILVVAFETNGIFKKIIESNKLITSEHSKESPCLADQYGENPPEIKNNILKITSTVWLSCGSWETSSNTMTFRYQNNTIELIGFDHHSFMRNSGNAKATSINFSTGKMEITTEMNEFEESKPKTIIKKIPKKKLLNLSEMSDDDLIDLINF